MTGQNDIAEERAGQKVGAGKFGDAIAALMDAYGNQLFRYCASMLSSDEEAQDVLQITFLQAYDGLEAFERRSTFRTWLFSIARNRCLDRIKTNRRHGERVTYAESPPEQSTEHEMTDPKVNQILELCLETLSPMARSAVLLRYQSDLTYSELAAILDEKPGTVQARVARSLPVLKRCVEENGLTL